MNSQNNHENNEVLRQEQEKHRLGLSGGMQLRTYKDDSAKKVMAITRKGVAQFEADAKLEDIKTSVDRFKVDKYFNSLSTSIAEVVNNYLQGVKQNDTGSIISTYNELCMYIKTVIQWKTLSENDRNMITAKFNELIPQINELMDVAITEKYTDRKQIEELKTNLVTRNYVPILYVNYAEAIKTKKPDYATRKELSTKLFTMLNDKGTPEDLKVQLEDKVQMYDDVRNKFVSAKNKNRKEYYKKILDVLLLELNAYIDSVFKSTIPISKDDALDRTKYPEMVDDEYGLETLEWTPSEDIKAPVYDYPIDKSGFEKRRGKIITPKTEKEFARQRPDIGEFASRKQREALDIDAIDQEIDDLRSSTTKKLEKIDKKLQTSNSKLEKLYLKSDTILAEIDEYALKKASYKLTLGRKNKKKGESGYISPETVAKNEKLIKDGDALPQKQANNDQTIQDTQADIQEYNNEITQIIEFSDSKLQELEQQKNDILYMNRGMPNVPRPTAQSRTLDEQRRAFEEIFPEEAQQTRAIASPKPTPSPKPSPSSKQPSSKPPKKKASTMLEEEANEDLPEWQNKLLSESEASVNALKTEARERDTYYSNVYKTRTNDLLLKDKQDSYAMQDANKNLNDDITRLNTLKSAGYEEKIQQLKKQIADNKLAYRQRSDQVGLIIVPLKEERDKQLAKVQQEFEQELKRLETQYYDKVARKKKELSGKGIYKGRGIQSVLRNAIRKPFVPKNPSQDDPTVNLYPQYDFSKFDIKRK